MKLEVVYYFTFDRILPEIRTFFYKCFRLISQKEQFNDTNYVIGAAHGP